MSDFEKAHELVVGVEGDYSFDPRDPGGETRYGISKRAFPNEDILNLTLARAEELYRQHYWSPIKGDQLGWPLNLFVYDCAVNQGVGVAVRLLQRAVGAVQDGVIGPKTLALARNATKEQLALFMADRGLRYARTINFDVYGRGWLKRLALVTMEGSR